MENSSGLVKCPFFLGLGKIVSFGHASIAAFLDSFEIMAYGPIDDDVYFCALHIDQFTPSDMWHLQKYCMVAAVIDTSQ